MNVRLSHSMPFTAGVYYGGEMRMNHYTLTLHMITNSHDAVDHSVAFERIKYFVYNKLDSSIFINSQLKEKCQQFVSAGLSVTTLPGDPVDQLIGLMLHYKLNAIMENRIIVDETKISSLLGENMTYHHSDHETTDIGVIPDWWLTADPIHSDFILLEADKIVAMRDNTVWRELDLMWPDAHAESEKETGNVVVFRDFKHNNDTK